MRYKEITKEYLLNHYEEKLRSNLKAEKIFRLVSLIIPLGGAFASFEQKYPIAIITATFFVLCGVAMQFYIKAMVTAASEDINNKITYIKTLKEDNLAKEYIDNYGIGLIKGITTREGYKRYIFPEHDRYREIERCEHFHTIAEALFWGYKDIQ